MSNIHKTFDMIVIGGGHAGVEAAFAGSRLGGKIALLNMSLDTLGVMSCNPAIGGLAKGHLTREIDALGGEMGVAADHCGIQFRMLNQTKGPAVWGPRAQMDKERYRQYMTQKLSDDSNISLFGDPAAELIFEGNRVKGVKTEGGLCLMCGVVVITTGTFLNGVTHRGKDLRHEGRLGEPPSKQLAEFLRTLDLKVGRLKTGTPCRLHRDSLDYTKMEIQPGDEIPQPFSFMTDQIQGEQIFCYLTHTTNETRDIILNNLDQSPLYSGVIQGIGPRYCPSIEDKIVKFKDKPRHLLFVEPEGLNSESIYLNGASSSLPAEVQKQIIHSIPGLEKAEILKVGYAIEYDFIEPTQLHPTLELKKYKGVFLAGQVNGTSGYEEAAAQGLWAGVNGMLKLGGQDPFILDRSEAYMAVLMDDLVTKGVDEPYRMFTSRAEHRLLLRQDTADRRLTSMAWKLGLISSERYERYQAKEERIKQARNLLDNTKVDGKTLKEHYLIPHTSIDFIKDKAPEIFKDLRPFDEVTLFADIKYEGYLSREIEAVKKAKAFRSKKIPSSMDYHSIRPLRIEAREKLSKIQPLTLGQASNIPGISPADIQILIVHIEKLKRASSK